MTIAAVRGAPLDVAMDGDAGEFDVVTFGGSRWGKRMPRPEVRNSLVGADVRCQLQLSANI